MRALEEYDTEQVLAGRGVKGGSRPSMLSGSAGVAIGLKGPEARGPWSLEGEVGRRGAGQRADSPSTGEEDPLSPPPVLGKREESAWLTRTNHS